MATSDEAAYTAPDTHIYADTTTTRSGWLTGGGTTGNERLTTTAGATLLILLVALGVTIIRIGGLLSEHLFIGMLLVPPVLLKMASTGYRFARYYTANPAYRRKGPPELALRALAPMVVLSTVVVFASGVALLFAGPSSRSTLFPIHKLSFFAWLAFMALHVLGHLPGMPAVLRADYGRSAGISSDVTGRAGRMLALGGALVAGVVLAVLVIPEFGPWVHNAGIFHHHH
ncbi:MAG TPA: hypothetical protein VK790_11555 [Solirubrobacteraceae bacterium]|jgi:hypothetical protein|nr:hypothetical protein [Solirubrobacteraceae bacterium]